MIKFFFKLSSALVLCSGMASQILAIEPSPEFVKCMEKTIDGGSLVTSECIKCLNT